MLLVCSVTWCRDRLRKILEAPPLREQFDCADAVGEYHWDYFVAEAGVHLLTESPQDEFARELVAVGIAGFHYGTTRRTMELAFKHRQSFQELFTPMQYLVLWWSLVRRLRLRSEQIAADIQQWQTTAIGEIEQLPSAEELQGEVDRWRGQQVKLISDFVVGKIAPIELAVASATGQGELSRLNDLRFPARRNLNSAPGGQSWYKKKRIRPDDPGLDTSVLKSGFGWLDLSTANSPGERQQFLCQIRDLLSLILGAIPESEEPDKEELDDLPGEFDAWIYSQISRAIVCMNPDDNPQSLWEPILELESFAHSWVERFFWEWFSDGVAAAPSPEIFVQHWSNMIRYALASDAWNPGHVRKYVLEDMVFELLGFHWGLRTIAPDSRFSPALTAMSDVFALAAARWCKMPRVVKGFAQVIITPGFSGMLCPGIKWIHAGVKNTAAAVFWREQDIESHLVEALRQSKPSKRGLTRHEFRNEARLFSKFFVRPVSTEKLVGTDVAWTSVHASRPAWTEVHATPRLDDLTSG